jgi:predicted nucleotidyltransferase
VSGQRAVQLQELCEQAGIAIAYAFGSRGRQVLAWARGELAALPASPSDVDIGVKALPGVAWSLDDKVAIAYAFADWLGLAWVDLVVLEEADPFLAANIIRGERLYADDEYLADEYDLYVLRRAGDLIPLERERLDLILNRQHDA